MLCIVTLGDGVIGRHASTASLLGSLAAWHIPYRAAGCKKELQIAVFVQLIDTCRTLSGCRALQDTFRSPVTWGGAGAAPQHMLGFRAGFWRCAKQNDNSSSLHGGLVFIFITIPHTSNLDEADPTWQLQARHQGSARIGCWRAALTCSRFQFAAKTGQESWGELARTRGG